MVDVSAIIVNYSSGAYTVQLVECLRCQQVERVDGSPGELEIIVVENCSPSDQSEFLDPLRKQGVTVLQTPANLGYAGGCNAGAAIARGRNLLFLNPDVFILPGGVQHLARYLDDHPEAGQVGPRGWFDCHRFFHLPRIELPTLSLHWLEAWRRTSARRAEAFALRRTRHALRIWSARQPQEEPVLAGYAFMMPAELAHSMGPFDDDYPLYFEDADLTRRVRQGGRSCMLVPESEMVHLYNKSAGQFQEEAMAKHARSQDLYFGKHYGGLGRWFGRRITRWMSTYDNRAGAHLFSQPQDLGAREHSPTLEISPAADRYVIELTLDPLFTLAVGRIDTHRHFSIPDGVWEHLDPTRYFVRGLSLPTLEPLGSWSFVKTTPCQPVSGYADFTERLTCSPEPPGLVS
jgi:GT2 family glycosyltransferase